MSSFLFVGLGGFIGASLRFFISSAFSGSPLVTLCINIVGSFCIGVISGISDMRENTVLFLKTGLLGGFTTFSAFSLETVELLEQGKFLMGSGYAVISVLLCVCGAAFGRSIMKILAGQ